MIRRVRDARDDGGFALVFVLFVTTVVLIGVLGVLGVVVPNVTSSKKSTDVAAALAAARSGVDDVIAYLVSIPSCRSESRICPAALGADSTKITDATRRRPTLGTGQSFTWTTASTPTVDGYVRVRSVGTSGGVSRSVVADLSLQPSILAYGYYTDYEAFSPQFLNSYYKPRDVYISDSGVYGNITSSNRTGLSLPTTATWNGAAASSTTGNCGQHWYYESAASPGRSRNGSSWTETGALASERKPARTGGCDLVFTSSMIEDGRTYTRDAINVNKGSGTGPKYNQPVFTMWGYNDGLRNNTDPAFPSAGQKYRGDTITGSTYYPAVAAADLRLPATIGTDGIPEDSCVYTGPTRVRLNGDGTATVTSPTTTARNAASDPQCYPTGDISSTGVVGWKVDYRVDGSGTLIARNRGTVPAAGWPTNPTKSTNTPSASNEVFYLPANGSTDVTQHTDRTAVPYAGCTTSVKYAATVDAACAWTDVGSSTDATSTTGFTSYTSVTCTNAKSTPTNRQVFECEYGKLANTANPGVNQAGGYYKTFRDAVKTDVEAGTCRTGTAAAQADCVNDIVTAKLASTNTSSVRYVATTAAGTPVSSVVATGNTGSPVVSDPFFTAPTPAKETLVRTPLTTRVVRQTYSSQNGWSTGTPAVTFTTTQSDYTYTAPRGASYFPNTLDVTDYNTRAGATQAPGDLYVDGANRGKLSVVADNDVIVTGNVTNPAGYTADTDAVSISAGKNVRNYHPVSCLDQDPTDIGRTTAGWCPNDITGLNDSTNNPLFSSSGYSSAHPARQYVNMQTTADRTVEAAIFAVAGSFRTDNYNRAVAVGDLDVHGGIYQSSRGGNGVVTGSTDLSGTTLQYTYVDLQRAELPYVPPASSGNYTRPWDVVSISAGAS